jgi:hypothetical protein
MTPMDFDHRRVALVLGRARAVVGLVLLALPGAAGWAAFGTPGRHPVARALFRLVGVRDLVLGVGAITTTKERTMDAEWVGMGAVSDGVDGLTLLLTPGLTRRSRAVALTSVGLAAVGVVTARRLADERARAAASEVDSR